MLEERSPRAHLLSDCLRLLALELRLDWLPADLPGQLDSLADDAEALENRDGGTYGVFTGK